MWDRLYLITWWLWWCRTELNVNWSTTSAFFLMLLVFGSRGLFQCILQVLDHIRAVVAGGSLSAAMFLLVVHVKVTSIWMPGPKNSQQKNALKRGGLDWNIWLFRYTFVGWVFVFQFWHIVCTFLYFTYMLFDCALGNINIFSFDTWRPTLSQQWMSRFSSPWLLKGRQNAKEVSFVGTL